MRREIYKVVSEWRGQYTRPTEGVEVPDPLCVELDEVLTHLFTIARGAEAVVTDLGFGDVCGVCGAEMDGSWEACDHTCSGRILSAALGVVILGEEGQEELAPSPAVEDSFFSKRLATNDTDTDTDTNTDTVTIHDGVTGEQLSAEEVAKRMTAHLHEDPRDPRIDPMPGDIVAVPVVRDEVTRHHPFYVLHRRGDVVWVASPIVPVRPISLVDWRSNVFHGEDVTDIDAVWEPLSTAAAEGGANG